MPILGTLYSYLLIVEILRSIPTELMTELSQVSRAFLVQESKGKKTKQNCPNVRKCLDIRDVKFNRAGGLDAKLKKY